MRDALLERDCRTWWCALNAEGPVRDASGGWSRLARLRSRSDDGDGVARVDERAGDGLSERL